ncbi:hypothetical protein MBLNU230_g0285t1 [Neophaeotheca triangularis]
MDTEHDALPDDSQGHPDSRVQRRTLLKLDTILLPFLSILFLLNSLDKTNIGNAESGGFTHDAGLSEYDLNIALAFFFAFFVALQPVGAALGRRYGMARWVPACMTLWGLSTCLHVFVHKRWQLVLLRVVIAALEAGFYPTTVSYLSMFYTKWEFAKRLAVFYGQSAIAPAIGGVLSWIVFRQYPRSGEGGPQLPPRESIAEQQGGWKNWQVLFVLEGSVTICIALLGFVWLPHSADTAWFLTPEERQWAEERIRLDREGSQISYKRRASSITPRRISDDGDPTGVPLHLDGATPGEVHRGLLDQEVGVPLDRQYSTISTISVTADSGLNRHDIISAVLNYKIWLLLVCNILSAIPATAFGVFLPLVIKDLYPSLHLSPAASNLLSAPPFAFGAIILFIFTAWSDRSKKRLTPILWGLGLLLVGLTLTVMIPTNKYTLRYLSLCVLLSGSYVASPLTVAWLTNNTPEPGKRAILLGINGWGNLAGVFSALLFKPDDEKSGYIRPFIVTLCCVIASFVGFVAFKALLVGENRWRKKVVSTLEEDEVEREEILGDAGGSPSRVLAGGLDTIARRLGGDGRRRGDEKLTFQYGL